MSSRIKTIEFATQTVITTLATATNRDLSGSTSIFIPETGGTFAFKSVILQVECTDDNGGTSANLTNPVIGIMLGNAAISSVTGVNPIANSGEEQEWTFTRDVTSYFTSTWSGSTMTWMTRVNFTGLSTANHSSKVIITYQYDDTVATNRQIKTIRIPIESTRTLLTTSFQTVGGATAIPAITNFTTSPYLPETGITIRQIFVELWGNTGVASNAALTMQTRFGGGTAIDTFRVNAGGKNSAVWARSVINATTQIFTGATSMECVVNTTTNRMCTVGGMIVVTYEFDIVNSSIIYNSLMLGAVDTAGWIGGTGSTDQGVWERYIYIEEPDNITLKESGLMLYQNDTAGYTFNIRCSGDTTVQTGYTSYIMTPGTLQCGCYSMIHRIDSGGRAGQAGISLKRGKNLYRVQFYSNTSQAGWNLSGFLVLNYTSGKHLNGVGVHAHTVYQHATDNITAGGTRVNITPIITPTIPETNYNLIGYLFWLNYSPIGNGATGGLDMDFIVDAEVMPSDPMQAGEGWQTIYVGTSTSDSKNENGYIYAAAKNNFSRWKGDPDPNRLNFLIGRRYRLSTGPLWTGSMGYWYTYNAITYTVSGTCVGFSGDGSGIPIDIYRVNTTIQDETILNLTTTTGGVFTGNWIDNTDILYAAARQDDTHVGRSTNGIAG